MSKFGKYDTGEYDPEGKTIEERVKEVMDISKAHGGTFTKAKHDAAMAEIQKLNVHSISEYVLHFKYKRRDLYGREQVDDIIPDRTKSHMLVATSYQQMAALGSLVPFNPQENMEIKKEACCGGIDKSESVIWKNEWMESQFRKDLEQTLENAKDNLPRIDKILCFGLGPLNNQASYARHRAIYAISTFYSLMGIQVQVYVQDHRYCPECINEVARHHCMPFDDAMAFVDKKAFVVSIRPGYVVRQRVTEYGSADGGPAAMLCAPINDRGHSSTRDSDPPSDFAYEYIQGYDEFNLSDEGENDFFGDLRLYLKKREAPEPHEEPGSIIRSPV